MVSRGGARGLLGAYELGRTLGEGNFGKVKQARHRGSGAQFAVKILDRARVVSQRVDDQIRREIATLKLLAHPNVVRLHEVRPSVALSLPHPLPAQAQLVDSGFLLSR
jgi:5'-AMP-activated protein kinase catalytic alpha subunit